MTDVSQAADDSAAASAVSAGASSDTASLAAARAVAALTQALTSVAAEAARAIGAEQALAQQLAAEVANRVAAINALTAGAPDALNTFLEAYTRFMADESAAAALTTTVAGNTSAIAALRNLSDTAFMAALSAAFDANGAATTALASAKSYTDTETTRAKAAEQANAQAIASNTSIINAETARAIAAEQTNAQGIATNASAISAETTRAQAAEQANATAIAANGTAIGGLRNLSDSTFAAALSATYGQLLKPLATTTTADTPTVNKTTRYDATTGPLSVSLPALSGLTEGATYGVQKIDTTPNLVTLTPAGSDTFVSGAGSQQLKLANEVRELQVVVIGGTKMWNTGRGFNPLSSITTLVARLVQWARIPDALIVGTITRDTNEAALSAPVVWPDGTAGTYTATTVSTAFPGAVDTYKITYGSPPMLTFTQPAVTRDTAGAVTALPAVTVA